MTAIDIAIVAAALAAAVGGWRLGFTARLFGWGGVAAGLVIAARYVPSVVTTFGGTDADDRVTVAVLFLVLAASIGQVVGLAVGRFLHRFRPGAKTRGRWDKASGALVGAAGVLVLVWMVVPAMASAKGWPARMVRDSQVIATIERLAPEQPARFTAWGRAIADAPYPAAIGALDDPPDPGVPPEPAIPASVDAEVRESVVRVSGRACAQIQEGSGWVAAHGTVVTNAHVVAGESSTAVTDAAGHEHDATVVAFDPVRDLAVLAVEDLEAPELVLARGEVGDLGAVYGHPGGGELVASPARVGEEILAVGTDIYRTGDSRREVFVLAASLSPGDSGGALVDTSGAVIGVAFAIDPGRDGTSYALTDAEVRAVLDDVADRPVETGRCLVD